MHGPTCIFQGQHNTFLAPVSISSLAARVVGKRRARTLAGRAGIRINDANPRGPGGPPGPLGLAIAKDSYPAPITCMGSNGSYLPLPPSSPPAERELPPQARIAGQDERRCALEGGAGDWPRRLRHVPVPHRRGNFATRPPPPARPQPAALRSPASVSE
jgi:hypothetical protein